LRGYIATETPKTAPPPPGMEKQVRDFLKFERVPSTVPSPNLPFPCHVPTLFCEMQLEKVIITIFIFYLSQKDHTLMLCVHYNLPKNLRGPERTVQLFSNTGATEHCVARYLKIN
jgi:hypothetical protein